jgi:predicted enzyme related to lactoylglutathione lyase
MSRRQQLISAVKTRFLTITTANSYTSNVGQKVFEWQTTPADPSMLPCILFHDATETNLGADTGKTSDRRTFGLEITASLLLAEADQTATKARVAIGDVIKAIGTDQMWGGLARRTEPVSDELMLDSEGARISGVKMQFVIEYSRKTWES